MTPAWPMDPLTLLFWTSAGLTLVALAWLLAGARRPLGAVAAGLGVLGSVAGLVLYAVADSYTGEGVNEAAWFHLAQGWHGLTAQLLGPFLLLAAMLSLAVGGVGCLAWRGVCRRAPKAAAGPAWMAVLAGGVGVAMLCTNPGIIQAAGLAWETMHRNPYRTELAQMTVPVDPQSRPAPSKSLVLVYAESLERTFLEHPDFAPLTPRLQALARQAVDVRGVSQAPLTSWTIAGQMASQCGHPALGGDLAQVGGRAGRTCLTDLLAHQGYALTYMNGANLSFGGKDLFWRGHGVDRTMGTQDVLALAGQPQAPTSAWGAYDQTLLPAALAELERLEGGSQPYALIVLTLDTHSPALPSPDCAPAPAGTPENQVDEVRALACADRQLDAFIRQVRERTGPDTVVALVSDHLRPRTGEFGKRLPRSGQSHNLALFWADGLDPGVVERTGTTLDLFPTLLGLLGRPTPAAALGRDLLDPHTPTLAESMGEQAFYARVRSLFQRGEDGYWRMDPVRTAGTLGDEPEPGRQR